MAIAFKEADEGFLLTQIGREPDDFDVLYRRFFPRLVRLLRSRVGEREAAEDLAQETLVRAFQHIDDFDTSRPLWPWLKTIATNVAIDHVRRRGPETVMDLGHDQVRCEFGWSEETPVLMEAMARLPKRQQVALSLRYLDDWRSGEAAGFLGLSRTSFEQLLLRARRKLRNAYAEISAEKALSTFVPFQLARRAVARLSLRTQQAHEWLASLGPTGVMATSQVVAALIVASTAPVGPMTPARKRQFQADVVARLASLDLAQIGSRPSEPSKRPAGQIPAASGTSAPSDSAQDDNAPSSEGVVDPIVDPNRNVKQPEDARLTSFAFSPNYSRDGVLYASGSASCSLLNCPPVLFLSRDGGATWKRLWAKRFEGSTILLPPSFGRGDDRIFSMGSSGLYVSENGGSTFRPAATSGTTFAVGAVAISPAFNSGDPTILIGAQSMMRYDDGRRSIEPAPFTALPGPLEPAYSPGYPADGRILVGGMRVDPTSGSATPSVFLCRGSLCSETPLAGTGQSPRIRLAPDFQVSNSGFAFTDSSLFATEDGGSTFTPVSTPGTGLIRDIAVGPGGRTVFVAVGPFLTTKGAPKARGGLFVSRDRGAHWSRVSSPLLAGGAGAVVLSGVDVFAATAPRGIACSTDGGRTWSRRC